MKLQAGQGNSLHHYLQSLTGILALLLLPAAAPAGGVVSECSETALRAATAGGGIVTFACDGVITLDNTLTNGSNLTIDGAGHAVTLSGGNKIPVFQIVTNATLTLLHLTVADAQGGIFNDGGTVNVTQVIFATNRVTVMARYDRWGEEVVVGGAAIFNRAGVVNATNCTFAGNIAWQTNISGMNWNAEGGAVFNSLGQVNLDHCLLAGNSALGVDYWWSGSPTAPDPGIAGRGGAVYNDGVLMVNECTFSGNLTQGGKGPSNNLWTGLSLFGGPGGAAEGGAIFDLGTAAISRSTFIANACTGGNGGDAGAIGEEWNWQTIGNSGGAGGRGAGGAIASLGSTAIDGSTFASNSVTGGQGGKGGTGGHTVIQEYGLPGGVGGPGGPGKGGALFIGAEARLVNCTFAWNTAAGQGGGQGGQGGDTGRTILIGGGGGPGGNGGDASGAMEDPNGLLRMTNCTVAFNSAMYGLGGAGGPGGRSGAAHPSPYGPTGATGTNGTLVAGISSQGGQLCNTLLAANQPGGNWSGSVADAGHNLSSDASCVFTNPASLNNTDPMLGPLADNSGPTLTIALLPGSPAIDMGDASAAAATDQRGFPRPFGSAPDIGAYEAMSLYTIDATVPSSAGGSVVGGGVFGSGSSVTLEARPSPGYGFVNWTEDGLEVSTSTSYTFIATTNRTLAANFAPLYLVAAAPASATAGSTSGSGEYISGSSVLVVANTNAGYQFVAWTENGEVVSSSPSYRFNLDHGRDLVAHFAPYPFIPPKGNYTGLFYDPTNGVASSTCGYWTLTIGPKGAYSGSLQLAGARYAVSGHFDGSGKAGKIILRRGLTSLAAAFELDLLSNAEQVAGRVGDTNWTAAVAGHRACFDGRMSVAPQCGNYTMILPGTRSSTHEPAGDGYGTVTMNKSGVVLFAGTLADGTKVTQSSWVSELGRWPLYASLYRGQGVLWSWLAFTNAADLGGSAAWIKPPLKSNCYPGGFSVAAGVVGTRYFPPGRGTNVLIQTQITDLTLTLSGGGLAQNITNRFGLLTNNRVTTLSGPKLNLAFTPSTGAFRGRVVNPATSKTVAFGGVVLQGRIAGSGFFLGTGQSGQVCLEP